MTATHEDIMDRLKRGEDRFAHIEAQQAAILDALKPLESVREDVAATKEIVEAWSAVKTAGNFLRWIGPIFLPIGLAIAAIKTGFAAALGLWK